MRGLAVPDVAVNPSLPNPPPDVDPALKRVPGMSIDLSDRHVLDYFRNCGACRLLGLPWAQLVRLASVEPCCIIRGPA